MVIGMSWTKLFKEIKQNDVVIDDIDDISNESIIMKYIVQNLSKIKYIDINPNSLTDRTVQWFNDRPLLPSWERREYDFIGFTVGINNKRFWVNRILSEFAEFREPLKFKGYGNIAVRIESRVMGWRPLYEIGFAEWPEFVDDFTDTMKKLSVTYNKIKDEKRAREELEAEQRRKEEELKKYVYFKRK